MRYGLDAKPLMEPSFSCGYVSSGGVLSSDDLRAGFVFEGSRVPLINPQRGIFKPTAMQYLEDALLANPEDAESQMLLAELRRQAEFTFESDGSAGPGSRK